MYTPCADAGFTAATPVSVVAMASATNDPVIIRMISPFVLFGLFMHSLTTSGSPLRSTKPGTRSMPSPPMKLKDSEHGTRRRACGLPRQEPFRPRVSAQEGTMTICSSGRRLRGAWGAPFAALLLVVASLAAPDVAHAQRRGPSQTQREAPAAEPQ